mgnify:CR=1 FL=1
MEIKKNSIVRRKDTNEVFEVEEVVGTILLCTPVNVPAIKDKKIPMKIDEVEVVLDGETDVFNLLFRD